MFLVNSIQADFVPAKECAPAVRVVALSGVNAILTKGEQLPSLKELPMEPEALLLPVGEIDGVPCCACRCGEETAPDDLILMSGRAILAGADPVTREAFCRAREMLLWRENHRFCGKCGARLVPSKHDLAMSCPDCGAMFFPQIAPAVIVAITRKNDEEILLAHNRRFAEGVFSLIAGFVEAGETVEDAVHREIKEETGIEVTDIQYLASQSWPFPNSLMLAFRARFADGEVCADGAELTECRWYAKGALPKLPEKGSIARAVIDAFQEKSEIRF